MNIVKNVILGLGLSVSIAPFLNAQTPPETASVIVTLEVTSESGTNGVAVAYNTKMDLYYTAFAGNESYELEVFNGQGFAVYKMTLGGDIRGLWYNPSKNQLEGILYDNKGSFTMKIGSDGFPEAMQIKPWSYGMDGQDVASGTAKKVYFVNEYGFTVFSAGKKKSKTIAFASDFKGIDVYNSHGVMYTGVKGYELALYNFVDNTLDLFSEKSGKMTASVALKLTEKIENPEIFRVSFCNKRLFLFDTETRKWIGLEVF